MSIRWTESAANQIESIFEYIASDSADAAVRTILRIQEAIDRVEKMPYSARIGRRNGTRELVVAGTPYIVVYRIHEEAIQILRVVHGAQNWP